MTLNYKVNFQLTSIQGWKSTYVSSVTDMETDIRIYIHTFIHTYIIHIDIVAFIDTCNEMENVT